MRKCLTKGGGGIIDGDILVVSKKFFEDFAMQNQIKIQVVSYPHFAKKLKLSQCLKNFMQARSVFVCGVSCAKI